jgi:hypothetical protein
MEFPDGIPEILYKYRTWEDKYHKRILTHNELFFASADSFNDPFDLSLPFQYNQDELTEENIMKKLLLVGREEWPHKSEEELLKWARKRYETGNFKSKEKFRNVCSDLIKKRTSEISICSLTRKNNDLLMWAHYAKSHTGFCIGFNKVELYKSTQGTIAKVEYENDFPKIPLFNESFEDIKMLIITKSIDWKYEDEYRIIRISSPIKRFKLNDTAIKEIVFGCMIKPKIREKIITIVQTKSSKIKLYDCVMDDREFKLNPVEIL